jgi:hypothetical protein
METIYTKSANGNTGKKVTGNKETLVSIASLTGRLNLLISSKQRIEDNIALIQEDIAGFATAEIDEDL